MNVPFGHSVDTELEQLQFLTLGLLIVSGMGTMRPKQKR